MNIDLMKTPHDSKVSDYVDQIYASSFVPLITIPTRVSSQSSTLIDHIYTNRFCDESQSGAIVADVSDHYPVFYIEQSRCIKAQDMPCSYRVYNENNIAKFVDVLERLDYCNVTHEMSCQTAYDMLHTKLEFAHNFCFPLEHSTHKRKRFSPWITPALIKSSKTKHKLYNKSRKHPTDENITAYKTYNNTFNNLKRTLKTEYFTRKLNEHKNNTKETWKILHQALASNTKPNTAIKSLKIDGHLTDDSNKIVNEMNKYFCNVSHTIRNKIPPTERSFKTYLPPSIQNTIFLDIVTETDVILAVKTLKIKQSSGHDNISTKLLQRSFHAILQPLTHIINRSFTTGIVPSQLKQAKVIPIYKSADPTLSQNYRPISLLPAISKIFERIMCDRVTNFLNQHNLFYNNQYGFRKSHSTIHPVLQLLTQCADANKLKPPHKILTLFCDLSKAFDVLDHEILLHKMHNLGIRGVAYAWFQNYLTNRTQYVEINKTKSNIRNITCGVPQGSILGPLLFLIYVNDIQRSTTAEVLSFADDTTLIVSSNSTENLITKTNKALSEIYTWFCCNKLYLNLSKTTFMTISTARNKINIPADLIKIGNTPIQRSQSTKFLGITIDEHLTWKTHISHINKKISSSLYAINQLKNTLPIDSLHSLYYTLIHPHLLYGIQAWGNANQTPLNSTFLLQKRAIRTINKAHYRSHTEPLFKRSEILKLTDMYHLQIAAFAYDFHHHKLPTSFHSILKYKHISNTRTTRSQDLFYTPTPHNKYLEKLPPYSIPKIANQYHEHFSSQSRKSFRNSVRKHTLQTYSNEIHCNNRSCPSCYP